MGGGCEGGSDGARTKELIQTVLTCEGNIKDPNLPLKISRLIHHLQIITDCKSTDWLVRKVEPWNSVKVTFSIPKEAAGRLHQLAQAGDAALRQLGILSVQVEGDQIVSLKVAGPNNETAEIVIPLAGPSGEGHSNSLGSSSSNQLLSSVMLRQHQVHTIPPFRSPTVSARPDVFPSTAGRSVVAHPKAIIQQGIALAGGSTSAMPMHRPQPPGLPSTGVSPHVNTNVQRHAFPSNPPPPYPNQDQRQTVKISPQQTATSSQGGRPCFVVTQANSVMPPSPSVVNNPKPVNQVPSAAASGYVSGSQVHNSVNSAVTLNRTIRGQLNMAKSSPLLVGLLQQPEQSSSSAIRSKIIASNPSQPNLSSPLPLQNGPIIISTTECSPMLSKSREASAALVSSGSVKMSNSTHFTENQPSRSHTIHYESTGQVVSPTVSAPNKITSSDGDLLKSLSVVQPPNVVKSSSLPTTSQTRNVNKEDQKDTSQLAPVVKKESQYLINPNTGLLEPRPNTDSSDSENETRGDSPDSFLNALPSDEEINVKPPKDTDSIEASMSKALNSDKDMKKSIDNVNVQEKESVSWENSSLCSSPGEKIKLKLKLGKEQVAQATFIGNPKRIERRDSLNSNVSLTSQNNEPRVPKLHIKLHPSQPVIIKSGDDSIEKMGNRRKSNKKFKHNDFETDSIKAKLARGKLSKDHFSDEEDGLSGLDSKIKSDLNYEDSVLAAKYRELSDGRVKVSRLSDPTKSTKLDSKLRTRLKKPSSMRKVGDLNSVGEIASHKIMENLPPSITKVAAMHTQQPHRNPNSLSPIPFSSLSPSTLLNSSISSSFSNATSESPQLLNSPSNHFKLDLEKGGSEVMPKADLNSEKSDIVMTKLCVNNASTGLVNGDVSHSEKLSLSQLRFKRSALMPTQGEFPNATKLTIKRKNSEETHTLKSLKKDGLSSVPAFLNASVLINKVSDNSSITNVNTPHHQLDMSEKLLKKVDNVSGPHRADLSSIKSSSDITIHSVSKSEILGLPKGRDLERRIDVSQKANKPEVTKVGRVTCVDVMDRKALEEALKSSRNSSKKSDINFPRSTTSMVDRLRRWNSIDSPSSVPSSSPSLLQTRDSTNLILPTSIKTEKERGDLDHVEPAVSSSALAFSETTKSICDVSQQSTTQVNVNKSNCDNSGQEIVDKSKTQVTENADVRLDKKLDADDSKPPTNGNNSSLSSFNDTLPNCSLAEIKPGHQEISSLKSKLEQKLGDLGSSVSSLKSEVDSPEGTPKGEHGNGQGGEDSGIESMDALSEKSPNHSDQSPNRREDKDCDMFQDKSKLNANTSMGKNLKAEKRVDCELYKDEQVKDNVETEVSSDPNMLENKGPENLVDTSSSNCSLPDQKIATALSSKEIVIMGSSDSSTPVESVESSNMNPDSVVSKTDVDSSQLQKCIDEPASSRNAQIHATSCPTSMSEKCSAAVQSSAKLNHECVVPSHEKVTANTIASLPVTNSCTIAVSSHISTTTASLSVASPKSNLITSSSPCSLSSVAQSTGYVSSGLASVLSQTASLKSVSATLPNVADTSTVVSLTSSVSNCRSLSSVMSKSSVVSPDISSCKLVSSLDAVGSSCSVYVTNSSACISNSKSNTMAYCKNSALVSTAPTMIIISSTTCNTSVIGTTSNTKIVTLKPGPNNSASSCGSAPLGRTFRLVALPGINSMTPSVSPVKGQLVTLKPGVTSSPSFPVAGSTLLQTVSPVKIEESPSSILKACLTSDALSSDPIKRQDLVVNNECHTDDLDFVGFSSPPDTASERKPSTLPQVAVKLVKTKMSSGQSEVPEVEPTPLRIDPPLYTYGSKEKKSEADTELDSKMKVEVGIVKPLENQTESFLPISSFSEPTNRDQSTENELKIEVKGSVEDQQNGNNKDKKLDALTIEIPNVEGLPDEKRPTRSTRQSARLASPKVNSPASTDVSPRLDKRSPANNQTMGRPSPVGVLRSSVSPALKGSKRRRHLSECSNASSLSEDQAETGTKITRKKTEKMQSDGKEDASKQKSARKIGEVLDKEKDTEDASSEVEDATLEAEEESRPNSRSGRSVKTVTRSMDRNSGSEAAQPARAGTPTRRTPRQHRTNASASPTVPTGALPSPQSASPVTPDKGAEVKSADPLESPSADKKPAPEKKNATALRPKRDTPEPDSEPGSTRRKTRSTANTAVNNEDAKRRRLSKEK